MTTRLRVAAALAAATLALVGCAGTSTDKNAETGGGELVAGPGFDPQTKTIKIGVLNPLSGPVGAAGQELLRGLELRIDRVNAAGGINGEYKVEVVSADTKYDPQQAISAFNGLSGDVAMIGQVLGTGVVNALLPQLERDKILAVPATDDAAWVRQPALLPTRPTYQAAFINGAAYQDSELGGKGKKYCTLMQDDATGNANKEGIDWAVGELGLDFGTEVRFAKNSTDFTPQIQQLKSNGCQVVFFAASSAFAQPAITSSVQLDFNPNWITAAPGYAGNLLNTPSAEYLSKNWIVSTPGAQWGDQNVLGMKELSEDFTQFAPSGAVPDAALNTAGYVHGMAVVSLLEKALATGDMSQQALLNLSHTDLSINFESLSPEFQYGPVDTRTPPTEVTIFKVNAKVVGGLETLATKYDSPAAQSYNIS